MKKIEAKQILSIPNILSIIRLLLIPVFLYLYLKAKSPMDFLTVGLIILGSGLTDLLDGFIARRFNMITELGIILDPVADKLTQFAVILMLILRFPGILWLVALFMVKEIYMLVNDIKLLKKGKRFSGSLWAGKVSTATFFITAFLLVSFPQMGALY
ncbi:MAG: CDP-alcohol phosphatidyltransferase family protein, partial [Eubacterium sp.]